MQVHLHTDHHLDGHEGIALHLENVINVSLARFAGRVTRVEAHITDREGHAKSSPERVHCTLEARVSGLPPISGPTTRRQCTKPSAARWANSSVR
jgi:hypothetical protein